MPWCFSIAAWWCIYESGSWVIIGSGNGLLPVRHHTMTWTNADLLSMSLHYQHCWSWNQASNCIWKCHLQNDGHFLQTSIYQNHVCGIHHTSERTKRVNSSQTNSKCSPKPKERNTRHHIVLLSSVATKHILFICSKCQANEFAYNSFLSGVAY